MKYKEYTGIILGALYGTVMRVVMNPRNNSSGELYDLYNIYSVTFIWVIPIVISVIPIIIARDSISKSRAKQVFYPILSVLLFFIITLTGGIEDWLCILIISFPFLLAAGIVGLIAGHLVRLKKPNKLLSIIFVPFLIAPLEGQFEHSKSVYQTVQEIKIKGSDSLVWSYLIEVPEIKAEEYKGGIFQLIGVPRPIKSELKRVNGATYRIGYFTGGLELYESISVLEVNSKLRFNIHMDQSKLRNTPTDQHILKSKHFKFLSITYELEPTLNGNTILSLKCDYEIDSKMNKYAHFWADLIISDFEIRLLNSLKAKIENDH